MKKSLVTTVKAPPAIGPYSQAVQAGEFVFVSGQIPVKADGLLVQGDLKAQTEQCLQTVREILQAAGLTLGDVVKTTVYLTDMSQFGPMNDAYMKAFSRPFPARATVQVSALPKGAAVEIEAIAIKTG